MIKTLTTRRTKKRTSKRKTTSNKKRIMRKEIRKGRSGGRTKKMKNKKMQL